MKEKQIDTGAVGKEPTSRLDGRWVSAGIFLLFAALFVVTCAWRGQPKTWPLVGVIPVGSPFSDLALFPATQLELAKGGDPYVSNASDPWGRVYNYPRLWLTFMKFPMGWVPIIGTVLALMWLVGVSVWWGRLSWRQGALGGMLLCSPPVILALERGNSDLVVFLILVSALYCLRRRWIAGSWLGLVAAFALKLYPAAAFLSFIRLGWKRAVPILCVTTLVVGSYCLWRTDEIRAISRNTPSGMLVAYGSTTWIKAANRLAMDATGKRHAFQDYFWHSKAAALITFSGAFFFGLRRRNSPGSAPEDGLLDGLRAGASIFVSAFILSSSYVYRHIFLLLCVPWLWAHFGPNRPLGRGRETALILLVAVFWINPLWWLPMIVARELCNWGLLGALGWLLGATFPRAYPSNSS